MMIKTVFLSILITFTTLITLAQVVVTNPALPIVDDAVTITFDATQGSGGLAGYTGDVYAHTGVLTENSTAPNDWKYVKSGWGVNIPETKMTRIGSDLYELEITPSIREYYGVPGNEQILQMAFVFRSGVQVGGDWLEGKTDDGGDIFVEVFEEGLAVTFSLPAIKPALLGLNEELEIEVQANDADSIALYINQVFVKEEAGLSISHTFTADGYGRFWIKAVAWNETATVADSFYYFVRAETQVEERPAGTRDGVTYVDDNTATLSLIAPGKEFVFVMGDFNDWQLGEEYQMKKTPDGERFWVTLENLEAGREYIYQYFINGQLKLADPFTEKTSDPWHDKEITNSTYPGLIQYPEGKAQGLASVLRTAQEPYNWQIEDFEMPKTTDLVVYELLVRDFTTEHSYAGVIDKLDYLESLGVNVIELMPVNEFEGNICWGYNPSFYFAPDKYYGPKNKLKELIDECHKRGMAVLIDMVLNHAYGQCPLVQMYFDGSKPTPENPWFNVDHNFTNPDAQWGYDFNHESLYTQQLIDSINSYWMTEYKVDGFRFDFTKGFGNNIKNENDPWGSNYDADRVRLLKRMADEIWERNPEAVVSLEHLAVNSEDKELAEYGMLMWGNMNYNYAEAAMGWHENGKSDFSGISYRKRGWSVPHLVGYMESHDEERVAFKCGKWGNSENPEYDIKDSTVIMQRLIMNALFFFPVTGPKLIWQFGEMAYDYSIEYLGRTSPKPVRWDYLEDYRRRFLSDVYGALIELTIENEAFESDDYALSVSAPLKKIVINHESMDVVIVGNFNNEEGQLVPGFTKTGTWYDYFTGNPLEVTSTEEVMVLQPGEHYMYTSVLLPVPQGTLEKVFNSIDVHRIYPNPASDHITMILNETGYDQLVVDVVDIRGRLMLSSGIPGSGSQVDMDISSLPAGHYFAVLKTSDSVVGRTGIFVVVD